MVIGYLQGRNIDTTSIPFHRLTHINFSFAIPAKNGGGLDALRNWDKLIGLVKKAHQNNVKVFLSVGGWSIGDAPGDDSRFHRMAETKEERNYFVTNLMELVAIFRDCACALFVVADQLIGVLQRGKSISFEIKN